MSKILLLLILAIASVESEQDPNAYNQSEDAVGYLQIRPIYVRDVNRILGEDRYSLDDRWDKDKSVEMFIIYTDHYYNHYKDRIDAVGMCELEARARMHNGGRNGWRRNSTNGY